MIQSATRGRGDDELAEYLLDLGENEQVEVLPARGVAALCFQLQLREMVARAAHGRTELPILHLHVNPPREWSEAKFARHLDVYEAEHGLVGQPRLGVFHRKNGRGHRHYVWSLVRRDGSVISMSNDYARREKISRMLEFEFGEPHVAGRHNRAVAAALRREGRLDVVASIAEAGLLEIERPVAKQTSAMRHQEKRTGVRNARIEEIVLAAWQATSDGPSFERALEEEGLALATGDEVPVLVDRTGNVHPLARLIGKVTKAADGHRISTVEVQCRIKDLKLCPFQDVRLELQTAAIVDDLEHEIVSMAHQSTPDRHHDLPGDNAFLAELAEVLPITYVLAAQASMPDIAALPGYTLETPATVALLEEAAAFLSMDYDDEVGPDNTMAIVVIDMTETLVIPAMVPDGNKNFEEEAHDARRPNQPGSTDRPGGDEFTEDHGSSEAADQPGYECGVLRNPSEHETYRGTGRSDRSAFVGGSADAPPTGSPDAGGAARPDHPHPSTAGQHGRRNPQPSVAETGPGNGRGTPKPVDKAPRGSRPGPIPSLEDKLREAQSTLRQAESQIGWLPALLKRWFSLSVGGGQANVDRVKREIAQLRAKIRTVRGEAPKPARFVADRVEPRAAAPEIVAVPDVGGNANQEFKQPGLRSRFVPTIIDNQDHSEALNSEAEDQLPNPGGP
jgi:hypothetical protein